MKFLYVAFVKEEFRANFVFNSTAAVYEYFGYQTSVHKSTENSLNRQKKNPHYLNLI